MSAAFAADAGDEIARLESAQKTWLPVHDNYGEVNVEKESSEEDALLNTILLNFDGQGKELPIEPTECIFKLSRQEDIKEKAIQLNGFGGVMLKN